LNLPATPVVESIARKPDIKEALSDDAMHKEAHNKALEQLVSYFAILNRVEVPWVFKHRDREGIEEQQLRVAALPEIAGKAFSAEIAPMII